MRYSRVGFDVDEIRIDDTARSLVGFRNFEQALLLALVGYDEPRRNTRLPGLGRGQKYDHPVGEPIRNYHPCHLSRAPSADAGDRVVEGPYSKAGRGTTLRRKPQ